MGEVLEDNRFVTAFMRDHNIYLFPTILVEHSITIDDCFAILGVTEPPDMVGASLRQTFARCWNRSITSDDFKARKNPVLKAMKQPSMKKAIVGMGHVEVDALASGVIKMSPFIQVGKWSHMISEASKTTLASAPDSELGASLKECLVISARENELAARDPVATRKRYKI